MLVDDNWNFFDTIYELNDVISTKTIYELNIVPLTLLTQFYLIQFNSHVQIGKKIQKI